LTVHSKPVTYRHYSRRQSKKQQKYNQDYQKSNQNSHFTDNSSECSAKSSYSEANTHYSDLTSENNCSAAQKYLIDQKNTLLGLKPQTAVNISSSNLGNKTESNDSGVTHNSSNISSGFSSYKKFANQTPAPTLNYFSAIQTNKQNSNYIGFSHLPNQIFRKLVKKGFDFNVMLVGESGLGKSTLINSLFYQTFTILVFQGRASELNKP
jgi:ribosome biogenesis GTPase A